MQEVKTPDSTFKRKFKCLAIVVKKTSGVIDSMGRQASQADRTRNKDEDTGQTKHHRMVSFALTLVLPPLEDHPAESGP